MNFEPSNDLAAGTENPSGTSAGATNAAISQECDNAVSGTLSKLIEQQMHAQYEEHRKKMEALQAKMENELLQKQAVLFKALHTSFSLPSLPIVCRKSGSSPIHVQHSGIQEPGDLGVHAIMTSTPEVKSTVDGAVTLIIGEADGDSDISDGAVGNAVVAANLSEEQTMCTSRVVGEDLSDLCLTSCSDNSKNDGSPELIPSHSTDSTRDDSPCKNRKPAVGHSNASTPIRTVSPALLDPAPCEASLLTLQNAACPPAGEGELLSQSVHIPILMPPHTENLQCARNWLDLFGQQEGSGRCAPWKQCADDMLSQKEAAMSRFGVSGAREVLTPKKMGTFHGRPSSWVSAAHETNDCRNESYNRTTCAAGALKWASPADQFAVGRANVKSKDPKPASDLASYAPDIDKVVNKRDNPEEALALTSDPARLRTPDEEDDLSTSLRLSLRQKHARQLANLRCFYEEEMDNLRCHMSSHEFLITQEPYKKLLTETERLQQRTQLLDDELSRAYKYINSVDKQMSALENTVRLITAEGKQSSNEDSKELSKLRSQHAALQEDYDALASQHDGLQKNLKLSQEALQASRKDVELLRVSLVQLRSEKQGLHEENNRLRLELSQRLQNGGTMPSNGSLNEAKEEKDHPVADERRVSSAAAHEPCGFRTDIRRSPATVGEAGARHVIGAAAGRTIGTKNQPAISVTHLAGQAGSASHGSSYRGGTRRPDTDSEAAPVQSRATSVSSVTYYLPNSVFSDQSDQDGKEDVPSLSLHAKDQTHRSPRHSHQFYMPTLGKTESSSHVPTNAQSKNPAFHQGFSISTPADRGARGIAVGGDADGEESARRPDTSSAAAPSRLHSSSIEGQVAGALTAACRSPHSVSPAAKRSPAESISGSQQRCAATPPAALLQAYSPTASTSGDLHRHYDSDTLSVMCAPPGSRPLSDQSCGSRSVYSGADGSRSGALSSERQSYFTRGFPASSGITSSPAAGDAALLLGQDALSLAVATVVSKNSKKHSSEKKAMSTQTPVSASDARKRAAHRKSPTRRNLNASFNATDTAAGQQTIDSLKSGQAVSSSVTTDRVNSWVDIVTDQSRLGAAALASQRDIPEAQLAVSPQTNAAAATAERIRLMRDLETRLDELLSEKRELEAVLSRVPVTGSSLQERLRKEEVEQQLDCIDRNLGSVRIALRRYKAQ